MNWILAIAGNGAGTVPAGDVAALLGVAVLVGGLLALAFFNWLPE